jgi:two-component system nitrogen regulation response regulator GlnG
MPEDTRELTAQRPLLLDWTLSGERRQLIRSRVPALTIIYHPDVRRVGERAQLDSLAEGHPVSLSRLEPEFSQPGEAASQPLGDRHLSRSPLRLTLAQESGVHLTVGESRTWVVADGRPIPEARTFTSPEIERGVVLELAGRVVLLLHTLSPLPLQAPESFGLVGESEGILRVLHDIRRVADLELPVLLRGETGTGKELVARAIHQASQRRTGPCVCLNMGAIPGSIATSELFGSTKGAFTGSVRDQPGYFQRAHGGTIFLDEIGEAPAEVQVMLLRVLESGEMQRVGGMESQRVDVRLIAATDADLEKFIDEGRFRAPLLHRLSGYEILIPPLRERRDDFGRLLFNFLHEELRTIGEEHRLYPSDADAQPWMPASVVARLARYGWPGNVRQLRNTVRQIVVASRSLETVQIGPQVERLLRGIVAPPPAEPAEQPRVEPSARKRAPAAEYRPPSEVTDAEALEALRANRWEVKPAAEQLGISRPSLYVLIDRSPLIRKASDLTPEEIHEARDLAAGDLDTMAAQLEVSKKGLQQRMKQLGIG